jgi:polar amino acid transport system substrate-binding protein
MFQTPRIYYFLIVLFVIVSGFACGNLPRDPKGTLQRVNDSRRIRVGLVENPPWVIRTSGEPAGAEVELVRQFAAENGASPEWFWGGEQQHFESLERFELDLVVGGFNDSTPWTNRIGLTSQYFENRIRVGFPANLLPTKEIKGMQIAAKNGEPIAAFLEKKDAIPVRVNDLALSRNMHSAKHVIATPPGENALIKRLDEFLSARRGEIKNLLQQQEEQARK